MKVSRRRKSRQPGVVREKRMQKMSEWNAQAVRRVIRAHGERVARTGGEVELTELAELPAVVDAALRVAVAGLRERGLSWQNVGDALGVSKQAAAKRFGEDAK